MENIRWDTNIFLFIIHSYHFSYFPTMFLTFFAHKPKAMFGRGEKWEEKKLVENKSEEKMKKQLFGMGEKGREEKSRREKKKQCETH